MSDYLGATEGELLSVSAGRRFLGYNDQRVLFPHRGQLRLEPPCLPGDRMHRPAAQPARQRQHVPSGTAGREATPTTHPPENAYGVGKPNSDSDTSLLAFLVPLDRLLAARIAAELGHVTGLRT